MPTVFFKVTDIQEKEVKRFMKAEGYASKAEFFRFLVKFYKFSNTPKKTPLDQASDELAETLTKYVHTHSIPSLEEQLADV